MAVATKSATKRAATKKRQLVICRTYSAGVEIGELVSQKGTEVVLANSRKLHRWRGANTLHEVALRGVDTDWSRLSEAVPQVTLFEAIELIPVSEEAVENLTRSRWPK